MKNYTLLIIVSFFCSILVAQQKSNSLLHLNRAEKILFLGNSITYDGRYVAMIESVLLSSHFIKGTAIINLGLPSETVSGLSEDNHANGEFARPCLFDRLESILQKIKPDVVFACYGMNDGIYLPFDSVRFKAYQDGIEKLYTEALKSGVKRIILITPPVHDDPDLGLDGYNQVLDRYSTWLLEQRKNKNWEVIDLHFPMKKYLESITRIDPTYKLAPDGIHPEQEGHWLMARSIISYLNPTFPQVIKWDEYVAKHTYLPKLYEAVLKKQELMKLALLRYTKHKRPGIPSGLTMEQANQQNKHLEKQISLLIKHD